MSYLSDFVYYASGTECPESYLWWAGLSLLGHVLGRKVWVRHGDYFDIPPNLFACLVGTAGTGKNTGMSVNIKVMSKYFPEMLMSASIQSREDVTYLMSSDEGVVVWKDIEGYYGTAGEVLDYRPFYILNDELQNFLSVDKIKMTGFLIEVFDGVKFSTGFKGDRKESPKRPQWFRFPHVSLLAGAVPEWFMSTLKIDLFSGGLGRRLFIIYDKRTKVIPVPRKPEGADTALSRAVEFLQKAKWCRGPMILDDRASKWWIDWYMRKRNSPPEDIILAQFHETRHVQTLKLAGLLTKSENLDATTISPEALEGADTLIEQLQEPIVRLTSGVGRNELAGVATEVLLAIESAGIRGVPKKRILATFYRNIPGGLRALDNEVLPFLQKSDKIVAIGNPLQPDNAILFTPAWFTKYNEIQKNGGPGK